MISPMIENREIMLYLLLRDQAIIYDTVRVLVQRNTSLKNKWHVKSESPKVIYALVKLESCIDRKKVLCSCPFSWFIVRALDISYSFN